MILLNNIHRGSNDSVSLRRRSIAAFSMPGSFVLLVFDVGVIRW
jgi:hypothetical protein